VLSNMMRSVASPPCLRAGALAEEVVCIDMPLRGMQSAKGIWSEAKNRTVDGWSLLCASIPRISSDRVLRETSRNPVCASKDAGRAGSKASRQRQSCRCLACSSHAQRHRVIGRDRRRS
jgi:hypothetical protein